LKKFSGTLLRAHIPKTQKNTVKPQSFFKSFGI